MTPALGAYPRRGTHPAVFLPVFCALAVAWTWPLALRLNWRIPHDPGDPLLVTWMLWWNTQEVPLTEAWWDAPIFFPLRGAFALSEHVLGISLFATPIQLAGGSALLAYNIALLLSFALSGFFSFLLVRQLTGSTAVGFCAGVAYAFAPYRASQLSHIQVLTSQWMPLALYALHRYLASDRMRWLVLFGAATLVQGLSHGYYIFFFAILLGLWVAWFVDWRHAPRQGLAIIAAWVIASLPLVPILWKYREVQSGLGLSRSLEEMLIYSGNLQGFLNMPRLLRFWPDSQALTGENYLFPGITVVLLIAAGTVAALRRSAGFVRAIETRSAFLFYSVVVLLMYALAMGPAPPDSGIRALAHPYTLLMPLPGFSALRVSARFAMLAVLCSSTAAGLALASFRVTWLRWRHALVSLVLAGLFMDGWIDAMPIGVPPGRLEVPPTREAVVLELPADDQRVSIGAMYRATSHGWPLINGYSGYTPPHYHILGISARRGDSSAILELARGRPLIIVVSERIDQSGFFRQLVETLPGIQRHGGGSGGLVYLLPARPRASLPPAGRQWPFTARQLLRSHVLLDLGAPRVVRSIEFPVRMNFNYLDRRMAIEASADSRQWTTVWEDWTGGPALAAALADPKEVIVKIPLRDVSARYLRIHPARRWVWKEMVVRGPA
jgi:hypothetical protein